MLIFGLVITIASFVASHAEAQLARGVLRLSLDTDVLSVASVETDPDGPGGEEETTVFGIGPNQLGGSIVVIPATPLGFGIAYTMTHKIMIGLRTGLGFDVIDVDGTDDKRKVVALSLMPGLTFVPIGQRAKLFITLSPLFQVDRIKQGGDFKQRALFGGFSAGLGTLIFPTGSVSADIGFFFEGRFGGLKNENGANESEEDVRDLRGVVRFGLSLWR